MSWYEKGLRFECAQCGKCCGGEPGYVWVDDADIARIARKLGYEPHRFEAAFVRIVRGRHKSLTELANGDCVLFDAETRGCRVYDARPVQCRTWPFWQRNLESPNTWKKVARFCKGCDRGPIHPVEEIERAVRETVDVEYSEDG